MLKEHTFQKMGIPSEAFSDTQMAFNASDYPDCGEGAKSGCASGMIAILVGSGGIIATLCLLAVKFFN